LLQLEDHSYLICTVQMYGSMHLYLKGEIDNPYYTAARHSPSPLSKAFDFKYFDAIVDLVPENTSAKALLGTKQRIPGVGNGVLQDILFHAGVHPKTTRFSEEDRDRLFYAVKDILAEMTELGGRDTEKDLFGMTGKYRTLLCSGTWKKPCPRCGDTIVKQAYLGGSIYFCPTCQPQV